MRGETTVSINKKGRGVAALAIFIILLVGLPLLRQVTEMHSIALFDAFYRAGSLVFGGGHVVLAVIGTGARPNRLDSAPANF